LPIALKLRIWSINAKQNLLFFPHKRFVLLFLFFLVFFLLTLNFYLLSTPVFAAANSTINFQGKIVNKTTGTNLITGAPSCVASGADTCDFRASIYTESSGGTLLWQETHSNKEIGDYEGVFNLSLNSVCNSWTAPSGGCSGSGIVWGADDTVYLQIEFDTDGNGDFSGAETFARKLINSVPFAYYSDTAGSLSGNTAADFLRSNASDTYEGLGTNTLTVQSLLSASGRSNPLLKIEQSNNVTYDSTANLLELFQDDTGSSGGAMYLRNLGTGYALRVDDEGSDTTPFVIDASGNVGIGTASPSSELEVVSSSTSANRGIIVSQTNSTYAAKIIFRKSVDGGSVVTSNYLASFGFQPYVSSSGYIQTAGFGAYINGTVTGTAAPTDLFFYTGSTNDTTPFASNTVKMLISSSGNVGIGTTGPTANLEVAQSTTGVGTVSVGLNGTTWTGVGTRFLNTFKVGDTITSEGQTLTILTIPSNTSLTTAAVGAAISAKAYTLTGGTRLSVLGNGNVGIGTTSPGAKLDISQVATATSDKGLRIVSDANGYAGMAQIFLGVATNNPAWGIYINSNPYAADILKDSGNLKLATGSSYDIVFSPGDYSSEVMRVTSTGLVGIGTTSPGAKLQINTGANATKGLIIKANSGSQSADLQVWQNSGGSLLASISPYGTLGIGVAGNQYVGLYITHSTSRPGDDVWGGLINLSLNGNVSSATGVYGRVISGANTIASTATGTSSIVTVSTGGSAGYVNNFYGAVDVSGSAYDQKIFNGLVANLSGSVTNLYGLYLGNMSGASNNYAIYTNSGLSRLGDQLSIVGSANRIQQIVKGYSSQVVNLQEWQNSGGTKLAQVDKDGWIYTPRIGIGDPPSLYVGASINMLTSRSGDTVYGLQSNAFFTDDSYSFIGSYNLVRGFVGGKTLSNGYAGQFLVAAVSDTITTGYGAYIKGSVTSGSIGTFNGLYIDTPSKTSGSITTNYGIKILDQNIATTNYAIYTGAGLNRLGDQLSVIGSANRIQLITKGFSTQTANLQEWQNSSGTVLGSMSGLGKLSLTGDASYNAGLVVQAGTQAGRNISFNDSLGVERGYFYTWNSGDVMLKATNSFTFETGGGNYDYFTFAGKTRMGSTLQIDEGNLWLGPNMVTTAGQIKDSFRFITYAKANNSVATALQMWLTKDDMVSGNGTFKLAISDYYGTLTPVVFSVNQSGTATHLLNANVTGLIVKANSTQTANLQEWQNSGGTVLGAISGAGYGQLVGLSTYDTSTSAGTVEATKFCTGNGETNCVTSFSAVNVFTKTGTNLSPTTAGDDLKLNSNESLTISDMTSGSVLFAGASGLVSQSNASLFWDNSNGRLGIGTNSPVQALQLSRTDSNTIATFTNAVTGTTSSSLRSTGTAVSESGVYEAWSNPRNATASDNSRASVYLYSTYPGYSDVSNPLVASNFGFTIPTYATITRIKVEVENLSNTQGEVSSNIQLRKGGVVDGDITNGSDWPITEAYETLEGANNDLWGTTWTPSEINASDFGVGISAYNILPMSTTTAYVDHIRITVYYSIPGTNSWSVGAQSSDYSFQIANATSFSSNNYFMITAAGTVGIGTTAPNQGKVEVKGGTVCVDTNSDGNASSCIASESDARLKTNVQDLSGSLEKILSLQGKEFDWNVNDETVLANYPLITRFAGNPHSIGLIAQDVQSIFPEAIMDETLPGGYLQLDYTKLIAPIIGAIQEQQVMIEALKLQVDPTLRTDLTQLRADLDAHIANDTLQTTVDSFTVTNTMTAGIVKTNKIQAKQGSGIQLVLGDSIDTTALELLDSNGHQVYSVNAKGKVSINAAAADASVGTANIVAGDTTLVITSTQIKPTSKVFVTAKVTPSSAIPGIAVSAVIDGSFTVKIDKAYSDTVSFDWWIVDPLNNN